MTYEPLVSIITTVHDLEPFVERCLQSVLDQTYQKWEQIIVDDGSTDGTEARIARFNDPRIRYVRLPRRGIEALAESYNTALSLAQGDLVAVLEGDDYWPPEKLSVQVPEFANQNMQLTWGKAIVVDTGNIELWRWPSPLWGRRSMTTEKLFSSLICSNILTPTVTVMVRKSALDAIGGFKQPKGVLYVDLPTWLMMSVTVRGNVARIPRILGYYRIHEAQMSAQYYTEYHTSQTAVVEAIIEQCRDNDLARVGWGEAQRAKSISTANLAAGLALLRSGNTAEARVRLRSALSLLPAFRPRVRAMLGLLSTFLPIDLVAWADSGRRKFLRVPKPSG